MYLRMSENASRCLWLWCLKCHCWCVFMVVTIYVCMYLLNSCCQCYWVVDGTTPVLAIPLEFSGPNGQWRRFGKCGPSASHLGNTRARELAPRAQTNYVWSLIYLLLNINVILSYFITDLELQLGTAPPPHNNTSTATWSGLLTGCRYLINVVRLQV